MASKRPGAPNAAGQWTTLHIYVHPRASRTEVVGMHGDAVKLRLKAPPVDGAANEELVRFLAARLRVARTDVTIVAGQGSRRKRVRVPRAAGDEAALIRRLTADPE